MPLHVTVSRRNPMVDFEATSQIPGTRWEKLTAIGHTGAKWVEFFMEACNTGRVRTTTRKTHLLLDEAGVRQLHAYLGEVLAKVEG